MGISFVGGNLLLSPWIALGFVAALMLAAIVLALYWQRLQPKLRDQKERLLQYETILNNAMVGIVYLKHRRVVSCNRRFEQIFGYESGELIGQSTKRFYNTTDTFDQIGELAYRMKNENTSFSTEAIFQRKDGSTFPGALNGCVIDPAHPHNGSIWIYADISDRHDAEHRANMLLRAVEQIPLSIAIVNREGVIEYVNPKFCTITGKQAFEVLGQDYRLFSRDESSSDFYLDLSAALLGGKVWCGEKHSLREEGGDFWEEVTIAPVLDSDGTASHFVVINEDITERKEVARKIEDQNNLLENLVQQRTDELKSALEAARQADQSKDAFLANMSHELRTPLNAVIGMANLAHRITTDRRQLDYLEKIIVSGKHLNRIINDLLDLSKIVSGHLEFENINFSLRKTLDQCCAVMAHRAVEKGLTLKHSVEPSIPEVLQGDPVRIEQILINLVGNGIKFTRNGGVDIQVSLAAREDRRVRLEIKVIDSGIGMRPEDISRLFQPFVQVDASINRNFGGTGLGLAISRRLTELMAGEISVSSQPGIGSTFTVTLWLPIGEPDNMETEGLLHESTDQITLPTSYRDTRVLLVEDQPLNREIVDVLLADLGISVEMVGNGQEAIERLFDRGPGFYDLVLMDVQMPVMDGLSATRIIRGKPEFDVMPIIGMTAHTMEHEKRVGVEAGMNCHIGKPFDNPTLFKTLAQWIPKHKQQFAQSTSAPVPVGQAFSFVQQLKTLKGLDAGGALARLRGKDERYRHWLAQFVTTTPQLLEDIRRECDTGRIEIAAKLVHSFKGQVGALGMTEVHEAVTVIEENLKSGKQSSGELDALALQISRMREQLIAALYPHDTSITASQPPLSAEYIAWNATFSVGEPLLDAQHKKLIGIINNLADCQRLKLNSPEAGAQSEARKTFHEALAKMFEYTQVHFATEEAHMRKIGFVGINEHHSEHASFIEKLGEFSILAAEGEMDMVMVHRYLKTWLFEHILTSDMQYCRPKGNVEKNCRDSTESNKSA